MAQQPEQPTKQPSTPDEDEALSKRGGNVVDGVEQPPSGVRPGEGRDDEGDADAGGTGKSL